MSGRHRRPFRPWLAGALVAVMVVAAGGWFSYVRLITESCDNSRRLDVAVAPEIEPLVRTAIQRWQAGAGRARSACVEVVLDAVQPVEVAAAVAVQQRAALAGAPRASGTTRIPDVWIPDSRIWTTRLHHAAPGFLVDTSTSLARSPLVMVVPEPLVPFVPWAQGGSNWTDLVSSAAVPGQTRVGVIEPRRDAIGLSLLVASSVAASAQAETSTSVSVGLMRSLSAGTLNGRQELYNKLPKAADVKTLSESVMVASMSEQAALAYNRAGPTVRLQPFYVQPAAQELDYPYVVMPGLAPVVEEAAASLRAELTGAEFGADLAREGFRTPDGTAGPGLTLPPGAPEVAPVPAEPDPSMVEALIAAWTALTLPARMLVAVDISGSMLAGVPSADGATRAQVTSAATQQAFTLFSDDWSVGLWTFSTLLDGDVDHREEVPIGPMLTQRAELQSAAVTAIRPISGGNTGLYDTILAAYQEVLSGWQAERVNAVLLMTDGENADPTGGLSREELITQLKAAADPERPVKLMIVGIGPDSNAEALAAITAVTGGVVMTARDPGDVDDVLLQAVTLGISGDDGFDVSTWPAAPGDPAGP